MTIVYKVVRYTGGDQSFVSAVTGRKGGPTSKLQLTYEFDKETRAPEGTMGIMCFKRYEDAWQFGHMLLDTDRPEDDYSYAILGCHTDHDPQHVSHVMLSPLDDIGLPLWENPDLRREIHDAWYKAPSGTVSVPSLTPIDIACPPVRKDIFGRPFIPNKPPTMGTAMYRMPRKDTANDRK